MTAGKGSDRRDNFKVFNKASYWDKLEERKQKKAEEQKKEVKDEIDKFEENLLKKQKALGSEAAKILQDNFWNLL